MRKFVPVSVVIPCFNCEATLSRAVESVLAQTSLPTELILVDDGSDDKTGELISSYADKLKDIQVRTHFQNKNQGPASARNLGWNLATQKYIAFLDADDAWHPQKLEIQTQFMEDNSQYGLVGHALTVNSKNQMEFQPIAPVSVKWRAISRKRLLLGNAFSTPTVLIRRDIELRFQEGKRYAEDYLLWLQIAFSGVKCGFADQSLGALFKARYGARGLSSHMWEMEKGELDTYRTLAKNGSISVPLYLACAVWSFLKFLRRLLYVKLR